MPLYIKRNWNFIFPMSLLLVYRTMIDFWMLTIYSANLKLTNSETHYIDVWLICSLINIFNYFKNQFNTILLVLKCFIIIPSNIVLFSFFSYFIPYSVTFYIFSVLHTISSLFAINYYLHALFSLLPSLYLLFTNFFCGINMSC